MQETQVQSLGWEDPLEEEMATYSSIHAWKVPLKHIILGNSLEVQWLGLLTVTAGALGSIPGQGTKVPQGYSVHVISQARILEWVAIPFSRGSSQYWD